MGVLGTIGRAAVERNHGVKGPATAEVDASNADFERVRRRKAFLDQEYGEIVNGIKIVVDDSIPFMAVLIGAQIEAIWLSTETMDVVDTMSISDFADDIKRWGPGMKYLVQEAGKYAEAAKRARDSERELIPAKDPLTLIEEDANKLVVQAASMQGTPSESQLRLFAERLGEIRARFEALGSQYERTEGLLDLAALAITDSLE